MKNIFFFLLAVTAATLSFAQDFGFDEIDPAGPVADINLEAPAGPSMEFSGKLEFSGRGTIDTLVPQDSGVQALSSVLTKVQVTSSSVDLVLALRLSPEIMQSNPSRILDEAAITAYLGDNWELQAGLVKVTWGKGDSLHVLDVVNPLDYTDFINPDPEDRKIPQGLVKLNIRTGDSGKLELVYVPFFEADTLPLEGTWAPGAFQQLRTQYTQGFKYGSNPSANGGLGDGAYAAAFNIAFGSLLQTAYQQAYATEFAKVGSATDAATAADGLYTDMTKLGELQTKAAMIAGPQADAQVKSMVDNLLVTPNTKSIKWSQGGLRFTDSFAGVDLGLQYYTGFLRTPVFDRTSITPTNPHLAIDYNRYHQLGFDTAFVLLDFNLRGEGAFNLTEDLVGSAPLVKNSFLNYTAGLDRTFFGVNTNLQVLGSYQLNADKITSTYDVELQDDWMSFNAGGQLSYKLMNDRVEMKIAGSYNLRDQDYLVFPSVTFTPLDDLNLTLSGKYFGGETDTQLGQYNKNSFVELKVGYSF